MERFLVTGALGCLGAWVTRELLRSGAQVVGADIGADDARLRALLTEQERGEVTLVEGDVTDLPALERLLAEQEITGVIHLAALQVPFCKENPPLGAAVNVLGTVNLFEAVKRSERVDRLVYASSMAVYGGDDRGLQGERTLPDTHYGVYKVANEGTARIYWQDDRLPSVGLRPYTVYGPTRDQGLTSTPTQAMLAAARGEGFHIPWGGVTWYQHARDVAAAFIAAARAELDGARVYNLSGDRLHMRDVIEAIEAAAPSAAGTITFDDVQLPFPLDIETTGFTEEVAPVSLTPFDDGVRETVAFGAKTAA